RDRRQSLSPESAAASPPTWKSGLFVKAGKTAGVFRQPSSACAEDSCYSAPIPHCPPRLPGLPLFGRARASYTLSVFAVATGPQRDDREPATMPRLFRPRRRPRLEVETLQDRLTPATITVTSLGDTVFGDGVVTLREAIQSVNAGAPVNADVVPAG